MIIPKNCLLLCEKAGNFWGSLVQVSEYTQGLFLGETGGTPYSLMTTSFLHDKAISQHANEPLVNGIIPNDLEQGS